MIKITAFLLIFIGIQAEENYYKLLGVSVDSDDKTIKRAFKKLGLKYHPDKNENNKEAEQMFMKIANAYEVLTDSEKRETYDKYGEAGLKKLKEQEDQKKQYGERYEQFFGGKKKKLFQENDKPDPFENTDVILIDMANINRLFRRNEVWLVNFYSVHSPHLDEIQSIWVNMAQKLKGIIKIAAINCEEDEELCNEYNIKHYPSIVIFTDNTSVDHEIYKGEKTQQAMTDFATSKMQNFVRLVTTKNFHEFVEVDPQIGKILIFTDKKVTTPQLKAFAKEFKGRVNFGEVRANDVELVCKFNIIEYPTIIGLNEEIEAERFNGVQDRDQVMK